MPDDPVLASLTLTRPTVQGGEAASGTVTLTGPAPAGGAIVDLACDEASVTAPPAVTIPEGQRSGDFVLLTTAVDHLVTAHLGASYAGSTAKATLTIRQLFASLSVAPASVVGGDPATGTIDLSGPAPAGGWSFALAGQGLQLPASAAVDAGAETAAFTIGTPPVPSTASFALTAVRGAIDLRASVQVQPPAVGVQAVSFTEEQIVREFEPTHFYWTVTLTAPAPPEGAVAAISCSRSDMAVPATLPFASGALQAEFTTQLQLERYSGGETFTVTAAIGDSSARATYVVH